jgi:cytidylate kinase
MGSMLLYKSVILSGTPASGKSALAKLIEQEYGLEIHSIGKLWRQKWAKLYPNRNIPFEDFWRGSSRKDNMEMDRLAKELIEKGGVIADSRYAAIYSDDKCLKIFLDADLKLRARRVSGRQEYSGKTMEEIEGILEKREEDECVIGKDLFGKDYRDSSIYHIVLNTGLLSIDQEFEIVSAGLGKKRV